MYTTTNSHRQRGSVKKSRPSIGQTDPLIGTQVETDSSIEAANTPRGEVRMHIDPAGEATKSRMVAGVLGLLLGGFGVHRFYLGFNRVGLFQLTFTVGTFILGCLLSLATGATNAVAIVIGAGVAVLGMLWGFSEGVSILLGMVKADKQGRPLRGRGVAV